jgi:prepilin-type N-terminal cleavage/methylation domain-containing protein
MKDKNRLKSQSGFSLVEVMIAAAIMGGLAYAYMQMSQVQNKSARALQATIARIDLEKSVINSLSNGAICSFLLNDSSQSTNRSGVDTFNSASVTAATPLEITIKNLLASPDAAAPSIAEVGKAASALATKLIIGKMKFVIKPNQPPDIFLADFHIEFEQTFGMRAMSDIVIKNIQVATDTASPPNAKKIIGCSGWGEPRAQRFAFTTSSTWTVPVGTRKAFVTMAGGGGSGAGWRIISNLATGHSGGYIFSQPINVTPGEVMQVVVGKGGQGFRPYNTGVLANPGPPYYIHNRPAGDDGLGGHPGGASKLISPTQGLIIECDGGSGASVGGIDNFSGGLVAGSIPGANTGSGTPTSSSPNRVATGPYVTANGPGGCGPGPVGYGKGNNGITLWGITSGSYGGGKSPFGFGSGGDVGVSGCYVNASTVGTCVSPYDGRDGVVYIDTW